MYRLSPSRSLLYYLDELDASEAALAADPLTAPLAAPFHDEIAAWEPIFKKERESRRGVIRAEAVVAVRNATLDGHTIQFGASVLASSGGDRKSPFFRRFFPTAPSAFVRKPLRKQCELTLHVVIAEVNKLAADHVLKPFATTLQGFAQAALDSLDARTTQKGLRAATTTDIEEWKEGVNTLRISTYAELLKLAAEHGRSRAWVNAFFRQETAGSSDELEEPAAPGGEGPEDE